MYTFIKKIEQKLDTISIQDANKPFDIHFDDNSKLFTVIFKYNTMQLSFDDMWNLFENHHKSSDKYKQIEKENQRLHAEIEELKQVFRKYNGEDI